MITKSENIPLFVLSVLNLRKKDFGEALTIFYKRNIYSNCIHLLDYKWTTENANSLQILPQE